MFHNYQIYIIILATGFLIALIIERFIYPRLRKLNARRQRPNMRIIVSTLRGVTILWISLLMAYIIVYLADLPETIENTLVISFQTIFIISFIYYLRKLAREFISFYTRKGKIPKTTIYGSLLALSIFFIGLSMLLNLYGVSITPILAALGVGGIAIALALQDTLANLFAGISILASRQINVGDFITLTSGEAGYIDDIQWRHTSITTLQNNLIIIPNKLLSNLILTNYSLPKKEISLVIPVGIDYSSDLEFVENITYNVAKELQKNFQGSVEDFDPKIWYTEFSDYKINFNVILRVKEYANLKEIKHEFIKKLHLTFIEEKIIIPKPIRTVYLKKMK